MKLEDRVKSLENEVAGMKLLIRRPASRKIEWESTVGAFESDPLFLEAISLGREYRQNQPRHEESEGS